MAVECSEILMCTNDLCALIFQLQTIFPSVELNEAFAQAMLSPGPGAIIIL